MSPALTAALSLAAVARLHGASVCVNLPDSVCGSVTAGGLTGVLRNLCGRALFCSPASTKQHHSVVLARKCEPLSQLHQMCFEHSKGQASVKYNMKPLCN